MSCLSITAIDHAPTYALPLKYNILTIRKKWDKDTGKKIIIIEEEQ